MTNQLPDPSNSDEVGDAAKIAALREEWGRRLACLQEPGVAERMRSLGEKPIQLNGMVIVTPPGPRDLLKESSRLCAATSELQNCSDPDAIAAAAKVEALRKEFDRRLALLLNETKRG